MVAADLEFVVRIALEIGFRNQFVPFCGGRVKGGKFAFAYRLRRNGAGFERTLFGIISTEVASVHDYSADYSRQAQSNDAPIVARNAAAARFPAVHPCHAICVLILAENR